MKINRSVFWVGILLLCINLLVLTRYILFKQPDVSFNRLTKTAHHQNLRKRVKGNWVLFSSIRRIYNGNQHKRYKWENIGGNILGFVPLGFLFPLAIFRRARFLKTLLIVFGISLFFEITQLYTGLGVFDVDDLLLNTFGGLIGYLFFLPLRAGMLSSAAGASAQVAIPRASRI